jgi:hypothetical protein
VLFSCFVVAVGAFLYIRHPVTVNRTNAYTLTHPPQAERMNLLMTQAILWCQQGRNGLAAWMTLDRFQKLMRGAAEATLGDVDGVNWAAQTAFLTSSDGREYARKLYNAYQAHVQSLFSEDVKTDRLRLTLLPAPDEPPIYSPDCQSDIC